MIIVKKPFDCVIGLGADCSIPAYFRSKIIISPFDYVFFSVKKLSQVINEDLYNIGQIENLVSREHVKPVFDNQRIFDEKYSGEIWNCFKLGGSIENQYTDFRKIFEDSIVKFSEILHSDKSVLFVRKHNEFEHMWETFMEKIEEDYVCLSNSISSIRGDKPFEILAIGSSGKFKTNWNVPHVKNVLITSSEDLKILCKRIIKNVSIGD